jgi:crotonobetaine/carnitine-CoA ligase
VGDVGEICVRPREPFSMFSGYLHDAERTVEAWRNLWFHTGDRGWFDDDGDLWFSDRIGDVVRRMGEFISSQEVEDALLSHPGVKLAAAFGVPSELSEDELMVAVVPQPGAELDAPAVRAWCAERLPRHAVPRYVELREELPMTPTGKIEKYRLRERGVTPAAHDARAKPEVSR